MATQNKLILTLKIRKMISEVKWIGKLEYYQHAKGELLREMYKENQDIEDILDIVEISEISLEEATKIMVYRDDYNEENPQDMKMQISLFDLFDSKDGNKFCLLSTDVY